MVVYEVIFEHGGKAFEVGGTYASESYDKDLNPIMFNWIISSVTYDGIKVKLGLQEPV
jgi:hypothetical protein